MEITHVYPQSQNGEINVGLIMKDDGTPDYWLLLAEAKAEPEKWQAQMDWAASLGENGEYSLPNLRELNLLRANAKSHFENDWYWSCEQHASASGFAWFQNFTFGIQLYSYRSITMRARAVRRLPC
jgi:hypothetical protein